MKNKLDSVSRSEERISALAEAEKKRHRQAQDALDEKSAEVKSLQSKVQLLESQVNRSTEHSAQVTKAKENAEKAQEDAEEKVRPASLKVPTLQRDEAQRISESKISSLEEEAIKWKAQAESALPTLAISPPKEMRWGPEWKTLKKAAQIAKDEAREAIHSSKKESDENHKNQLSTLRLALAEKRCSIPSRDRQSSCGINRKNAKARCGTPGYY